MKKFTVYMGLNDKDTKSQKISTLEAYKIVENVIKAHDFDGATIYESVGLYKHESGVYVKETSFRIELLFTTESLVRILVSELKTIFNQESIAVQQEAVESELW